MPILQCRNVCVRDFGVGEFNYLCYCYITSMFVTVFSSSKHVLVNWYVSRTGALDCVKATYYEYVNHKQSAGRCNPYTIYAKFWRWLLISWYYIVAEHQSTWPTWIQKIMNFPTLLKIVLSVKHAKNFAGFWQLKTAFKLWTIHNWYLIVRWSLFQSNAILCTTHQLRITSIRRVSRERSYNQNLE